jgi:hypothetical protein|tara:strand:+ start:340 stop:528 length:189 start_codon:yes stop_codon:yes gene_type:complete
VGHFASGTAWVMTKSKGNQTVNSSASEKAEERKQRQAAQLRANLQRRKEQIRRRTPSEKTDL